MIQKRDIDVLLALVRYYVLNRQQIQALCFPTDPNGRITRRRLQLLVNEHLISRQGTLFCHPSAQPAAPVYFPSKKGCELLFEHFEDPKYLVTPTYAPIPHHTFHWLAVSDTHIAFDSAVERQNGELPKRNGTKEDHRFAKIADWINEWDIVNKDETAPEKRFRLYTILSENPKIICCPDAAFLVTYKGHGKVFYLEQDRATSGVLQIANSKTKGYAVMAEQETHRRHFPETTLNAFTVLMITPSSRRRDSLRRAIKDKPGAALWRFAAVQDVTPEKALFQDIWYSVEDTPPAPMIKGGQ